MAINKIIIENSSGNVGIGTTNPGARLHIAASGESVLQIQDIDSSNLNFFLGKNGAESYFLSRNGSANGHFAWYTSDGTTTTARMRLTETGNVGIGTTSPSQKLEVAGTIRGEVLNAYGTTDPASTSPYFFSPTTGALGIGANGSERVRITNGGSVGIGTTNPGRLLHVYPSSGDGSMAVQTASNNGVAYVYYFCNNSRALEIGRYGSARTDTFGGVTLGNWSIIRDQNASSSGLVLGTTGAVPAVFVTNDTERLRITSGGNVGIGTNNPSQKIEAYGTDSGIIAHYSGNSRGGIFALESQKFALGTTASADDILFGYGPSPMTSAGFVERMRIDNGTGNVGIGTTNPAAKLDVNGAIRSMGNGDPNYSATLAALYDSSHGLALYCRINDVNNSEILGVFAEGGGANPRLVLNPTNGWRVGIGSTAPAEKLDISGGRLKIENNGYGWIYGTDTNHSIILRGNRDGTAGDFSNYHQYGGNLADGKGHRFWTGGVLASQTEKFRICDDAVSVYTTFTRGINYWSDSPGSYSAGGSVVQTQYGPEIQPFHGWKELAIISTRAFHDYMDIKTNITSDNIMFWFKFMGYNYGYGNTYYFGGGYTYVSDVINKAIGTGNKLLGNAYVYDLYRATADNALCVKIYLGHQGYTEGRTHVYFGAHNGDVSRSASIVSSVVYNSTSRYF